MKVSTFNSNMKKLQSENGKQYLEEILQYAGYFFLNLTEKQHNKIASQIASMGYPTTERNGEKWVVLPNGLQLQI